MSDAGSEFEEEEQGPYLGEYEGKRNEKEERHGLGKTTLPNHDTYQGQYDSGKRHGQGTYRFVQGAGARYVGEYSRNKKHGKGTFIYPDGSKYEGSWVDDQRCGFGKYFYINGDIYEGEWQNHVRHGQGTYVWADTGSKYVGAWSEGRMNGVAELIHANHKYVGSYKDSMPTGRGKYVFDIGCQQHGKYVAVEKTDNRGGEEEAAPVLEPQWRAGDIREVRLDQDDDDLFQDDRRPQPAEKAVGGPTEEGSTAEGPQTVILVIEPPPFDGNPSSDLGENSEAMHDANASEQAEATEVTADAEMQEQDVPLPEETDAAADDDAEEDD